jgi:hypothetical protein
MAGVLACFGVLPPAQAVVPPPDGGYPGFNTAEGTNALKNLTTGSGNTGVGWYSLFSATTPSFNTGVGAGTLTLNSADNSTAIGAGALLLNTTGEENTATGAFSLLNNTEGDFNTATGYQALLHNDTGDYNTADGLFALGNLTSGFNNTAVGRGAGFSVTTAEYVICIGANGANVSNSCYIGEIWQQPGGSQAVYINADGKLGALVSSRRFKDQVKPMEHASEVIYQLNPVSFRYKPEIEPGHLASFGLIAEEVENVHPDLVLRDKEGKPYTVRYEQVNVMLLNEFLKEHKTVQDQGAIIAELKSTVGKQDAATAKQEATIARLEQKVAALTAGLQKVSAQLELNKPAPQTALNGR